MSEINFPCLFKEMKQFPKVMLLKTTGCIWMGINMHFALHIYTCTYLWCKFFSGGGGCIQERCTQLPFEFFFCVQRIHFNCKMWRTLSQPPSEIPRSATGGGMAALSKGNTWSKRAIVQNGYVRLRNCVNRKEGDRCVKDKPGLNNSVIRWICSIPVTACPTPTRW